MFKKIVSNLGYSPALVGQLGFYAHRLKKEEATRRIGLIFTALALVVQSFAVFTPPESANASSPNDMIYGGVTSLQQYLTNYDANTNNIKDLFNAIGISRADIANAKAAQINSKDGVYSWGMNSRFSKAEGERTYTVRTSNGGLRTYYYRPMPLYDSGSNKTTGSYYNVFAGKTSKGMYFALMKDCGNLVLKMIPPVPACPAGTSGTYPNCVKIETPVEKCTFFGKDTIAASDPNCKATPCPTGTSGTYPNCVKVTTSTPKCTITGKESLAASDPNCKVDQVPTATCLGLTITPLTNNRYQLVSKTSTSNGASVSSYTYTITKDGKTVFTKTNPSKELEDSYIYTQGDHGVYTVTLTADSSTGKLASANCTRTFTVAAPELCSVNPKLTKDSPDCQPCPGDETIWIKDAKCVGAVVLTKTAVNTTQNTDARKVTANPGDTITYSLHVENRGIAPISVNISEQLDDVMQYANIINNGSGSLLESTLTWPAITLAPGEKQTRMLSVKVNDTIPAMATGKSDKSSYDCRMTNTFGNTVEIAVACPIEKQVVEQVVAELPHTGPGENMIFGATTLAIVSYFYARSRQVKKEVRLIRRDFNAGTI